nr:SGNH/GDSL hydrolase family protein [Seonamhaeicola algicola]
MKKLLKSLVFSGILYFGCSSSDIKNEDTTNTKNEEISTTTPETTPENVVKILSLGDSYTIGESVCNTCRFPEQLKDSIIQKIGNNTVSLKVIAQTGWTTSALKNAINNDNLDEDYNLATLLIGVNNQYQRQPFSIFEKEFPELVSSAITFAQLKKENVIIVSIPDYAYTPFGNGDTTISEEINKYNNFIENYCNQYGITYINITDITREGLENPALVASDGLHPSTLAYSKFVSLILPEALFKIGYSSN